MGEGLIFIAQSMVAFTKCIVGYHLGVLILRASEQGVQVGDLRTVDGFGVKIS